MTNTIYDIGLDRNPANFQPLTPLSFLERAAAIFPQRTAIVHGARSWTYGEFYARARRLASALAKYQIWDLARRHRVGDACQYARDARRPLRCRHDGGGAQRAQYQA